MRPKPDLSKLFFSFGLDSVVYFTVHWTLVSYMKDTFYFFILLIQAILEEEVFSPILPMCHGIQLLVYKLKSFSIVLDCIDERK